MTTVLSVIGTRPEAIKMAPVVAELSATTGVRSLVCSTGQHREMLKQVFDLFDISPDFELDVMRPNQGLTGLTARLIEGLDDVVSRVQPSWVLAQGDTTTVLSAALVAFYGQRKFGHVEAGLRTDDKHLPYPEEMNRRLADVIADAYFAPTDRAAQGLVAEGHPREHVYVTGNTVVDALLRVAEMDYDWSAGPLQMVPQDRRLVLVTAHRRESFGAPIEEICHAIHELAAEFKEAGVHFVFPVHLNPNVQEPVRRILSGLDNVSLLEPLDYQSLVQLMKESTMVLTDSGGIQEEAPTFSTPVLVLRDNTERPEGIEAGVCKLVGTARERIVNAARTLLNGSVSERSPTFTNPYGDGTAAARIAKIVVDESC